MNWQPGDRAIVDCPSSLSHGCETSVLRIGVEGISTNGLFIGCEVDLPCSTSSEHPLCVFEYHELKPIYDGNETVSWESCIWQPDVVTI